MLMGSSTGLLLTAVAGYWVMERAERHKNGMRLLGKVLGAIIILASFLSLACGAACNRGMMMKGMCPLSAPASPMGKP